VIERIHLSILREVDRSGSLTSAAKNLNLTQSALSHCIKKLEAQLNTSLWLREGRTLKLTQAGEYLLREARRLLPQFARIDEMLAQYACGEKGTVRIGMECHPCYQWLLQVVGQFLEQKPGVDLDVKQRFQFGGMAALFNYEIDLLVTPDPIVRQGIFFTPVFDYEQVLVVGKHHPFAQKKHVEPHDLENQTLYTYPVEIERLDIYRLFLMPAQILPLVHKTIEATEMMLQLVAANRGVATLPLWLVNQYALTWPIVGVRLGINGVFKQIHLGYRTSDGQNSLTQAFVSLAKKISS
jgi:LysR family transcriptional regulator for metE and metH